MKPLSDIEREKEINYLKFRIIDAHDIRKEKKLITEMNVLIKARSPEQIAKMEREKGLV